MQGYSPEVREFEPLVESFDVEIEHSSQKGGLTQKLEMKAHSMLNLNLSAHTAGPLVAALLM